MSKITHNAVNFVAAVTLAFAVVSCSKKKSSSHESAEPAVEVIAGVQPAAEENYSTPSTPTTTIVTTSQSPGFALTRLTPEQLANSLNSAVNFGSGTGEYFFSLEGTGQSLSYIQFLYGVPLGGIDFETTSIRDNSTKAQTLLVSRVIAIQYAMASMGKEYNKPDGTKEVFVFANMNVDRPFRDADLSAPASTQAAIRQGEAKWDLQLDDFFYRFYSRKPEPIERNAAKATFLEAMDSEGYVAAGWISVIYALISSQEFWHQ